MLSATYPSESTGYVIRDMLSATPAVPNRRTVPVLLQSELRLPQALLPLVALARGFVGGALLRLHEFDGFGLRGVFHDDGLGRRGALPLGLLTTCGGGALGVLRLGFRSRGGLAFCY